MKSKRQARAIFITMFILFAVGIAISLWAEYSHNNVLNVSGAMEGKETRFGVMNSVLWSVTIQRQIWLGLFSLQFIINKRFRHPTYNPQVYSETRET